MYENCTYMYCELKFIIYLKGLSNACSHRNLKWDAVKMKLNFPKWRSKQLGNFVLYRIHINRFFVNSNELPFEFQIICECEANK